MNLVAAARALGGIVSGRKVLAPGPGHSRSDRSLSVWIDASSADGFRVHSFAGDDWRDCCAYVRERLGLRRSAPELTIADDSRRVLPPRPADSHRAVMLGEAADDRDRIRRALAFWQEGVPIAGTIAEQYLRSRGLFIITEVKVADALRFHGGCPFRLEDGATARLPTMLGLMRDIVTDEPKAIHRTALRADGTGKADFPGLRNAKRMMGPAKGAVVKLSAHTDVTDGLGIAEGIESALTIVGAGWQPIWACGSAGGIERFPILSGIESLTIFADADRAGMTVAQLCQARWVKAGLECRILAPPQAGADWNDMVRADAA